MSEEKQAFEGWAKLELMGHRVLYGRLSEQEIAGKGFIRIDIPGANNGKDLTQFYAPDAVYAISPLSEELARAMAGRGHARPVDFYELPQEYKDAIREANERKLIEHKAEDGKKTPPPDDGPAPDPMDDDDYGEFGED